PKSPCAGGIEEMGRMAVYYYGLRWGTARCGEAYCPGLGERVAGSYAALHREEFLCCRRVLGAGESAIAAEIYRGHAGADVAFRCVAASQPRGSFEAGAGLRSDDDLSRYAGGGAARSGRDGGRQSRYATVAIAGSACRSLVQAAGLCLVAAKGEGLSLRFLS